MSEHLNAVQLLIKLLLGIFSITMRLVVTDLLYFQTTHFGNIYDNSNCKFVIFESTNLANIHVNGNCRFIIFPI